MADLFATKFEIVHGYAGWEDTFAQRIVRDLKRFMKRYKTRKAKTHVEPQGVIRISDVFL